MSNTVDSRINGFLDEQMNCSDQEAFVNLLGEDAQLRAAVEQQQAIDFALRRLYSEDRLHNAMRKIDSVLQKIPYAPGQLRTPLRRWRALSAAALLAVSLAGLWYSWAATRPLPAVDVYEAQPWRSFATVYDDTIRNGFKPAWICRNESQFERAFTRRFQQPLLLAALPSGVTAGGISYSNTMSQATINVLGRVEGTPVMIFVDKRAAEVGPPAPLPSGLHIFRREIDELVLYELTPLDRPNILPYFYRPKKID